MNIFERFRGEEKKGELAEPASPENRDERIREIREKILELESRRRELGGKMHETSMRNSVSSRRTLSLKIGHVEGELRKFREELEGLTGEEEEKKPVME